VQENVVLSSLCGTFSELFAEKVVAKMGVVPRLLRFICCIAFHCKRKKTDFVLTSEEEVGNFIDDCFRHIIGLENTLLRLKFCANDFAIESNMLLYAYKSFSVKITDEMLAEELTICGRRIRFSKLLANSFFVLKEVNGDLRVTINQVYDAIIRRDKEL